MTVGEPAAAALASDRSSMRAVIAGLVKGSSSWAPIISSSSRSSGRSDPAIAASSGLVSCPSLSRSS